MDYDETFSPVVKPATVRTVLSLALSRSWLVHQLDVKNVFLHDTLSKTVYYTQPAEFVDSSRPDMVSLWSEAGSSGLVFSVRHILVDIGVHRGQV